MKISEVLIEGCIRSLFRILLQSGSIYELEFGYDEVRRKTTV